jgi:hypothetical protein
MTDSALPSAQLRRLDHLAARLKADRCAVVLDDPRGEIAAMVARRARSAVHCVGVSDPVAAILHLERTGVRHRVNLLGTPPEACAAQWRAPVGLLCLAGEPRLAPSRLSHWGRHVAAEGHVLLLAGGLAPPSAGAIHPDLWAAFPSPDHPLLLQRLPYG